MDHGILVLAAGLAAGTMNALAGGGSFVSLPALIAAGVPSVQANASSTVALFPGGAASAWTYRDGLRPVGAASLPALLIATLIGGAVGAVLLLSTPTRAFDLALPWLLLLASIALAAGPRLGPWLRRHCELRPSALLGVQAVLGVYGGYFGGAVGIMMVAAWSLLDGRDLKSMNAPRTLLTTAANTIAVMIFIVARAVYWRQTLIMLVGAIAGGYFGALIGRRIPPHLTRRGTLIVALCITALFFARAYTNSRSP